MDQRRPVAVEGDAGQRGREAASLHVEALARRMSTSTARRTACVEGEHRVDAAAGAPGDDVRRRGRRDLAGGRAAHAVGDQRSQGAEERGVLVDLAHRTTVGRPHRRSAASEPPFTAPIGAASQPEDRSADKFHGVAEGDHSPAEQPAHGTRAAVAQRRHRTRAEAVVEQLAGRGDPHDLQEHLADAQPAVGRVGLEPTTQGL
jgi:hypothetical protein